MQASHLPTTSSGESETLPILNCECQAAHVDVSEKDHAEVMMGADVTLLT